MIENLELAAALRLPLNNHQGSRGCCSSQAERDAEVKKVVGEVTALMALTKVQHKVGVMCLTTRHRCDRHRCKGCGHSTHVAARLGLTTVESPRV